MYVYSPIVEQYHAIRIQATLAYISLKWPVVLFTPHFFSGLVCSEPDMRVDITVDIFLPRQKDTGQSDATLSSLLCGSETWPKEDFEAQLNSSASRSSVVRCEGDVPYFFERKYGLICKPAMKTVPSMICLSFSMVSWVLIKKTWDCLAPTQVYKQSEAPIALDKLYHNCWHVCFIQTVNTGENTIISPLLEKTFLGISICNKCSPALGDVGLIFHVSHIHLQSLWIDISTFWSITTTKKSYHLVISDYSSHLLPAQPVTYSYTFNFPWRGNETVPPEVQSRVK